MARREVRASWRRLLFFFVCIGVGVAAIVAVRSQIRNVNDGVASQARELITADVQADTSQPWSQQELADINTTSAHYVAARTETEELPTMLRPADASKPGLLVVELKGIQRGFPLYGELTLKDGKRFDFGLLQNNGAVVAPTLLDRLNLNVGEKVSIGKQTFEIRGVIDHEPGGGGGFRLGPRVFVDESAIESTGLAGFGSRVRRRILFKVRDDRMVDRLDSDLKSKLRAEHIHVNSYRDSQENISDALGRAENYMSLIGLIVLVLGGIGISNVTRVFIEQRKKSIAVLKCIGGRSRKIAAVYLSQVLVLALAGSVFGVGLARLALAALSHYFAASLPQNISYSLQPTAIAQGVAIGLLICILFSALPLLRIRKIKPNSLFRDEVAGRRSFDPLRVFTGIVVVAGLVAVCSWQAGSLRVGLYFLSALAITAALLYLAASVLIALVRRVKRAGSFAVRQGINSLYRPGNQTKVIVMAVGLGVFLIIAVWSLQSNLLKQFNLTREGGLPNMFLIGVQKDQSEGISSFIKDSTGKAPLLIPTLRARITAVDGKQIETQDEDRDENRDRRDRQSDARREQRRLGREYVVTYRAGLDTNETVSAGQLWPPAPSSAPEVSLDQSMRGLMGFNLGSSVTFNIQGRDITAKVTSFRKIDLKNARTAFQVLFRPGTLEDAPQMIVVAVNGPDDDTQRTQLQRSLVDKYPNLTVIDVAEVVRVVEKVIDNITLAVSFIGAFVFLSGALILIGSIAMTKFQRVYEIALMKTLGAKRKTMIGMMLSEYGLLGLLAGIIGSGAGIGLSYTIAKRILDIPWHFASNVVTVGIAGTLLMVTIVGAAASFDALTHKPLSILRSE